MLWRQGEPDLFSEQDRWSAQNSKRRTYKNKRPKIKANALHLSKQDTTTCNLVPVAYSVLNKCVEPDPRGQQHPTERVNLKKGNFHSKLYLLTS